jgi:hypothetical protein
MGLLSKVVRDDSVAADKDVVGGQGKNFKAPSDVYEMTIEYAYETESKGGAIGVVLKLVNEAVEHTETLWVQGKNGQNYYEHDGKRNYIPGFTAANDLTRLTLDAEISEVDTEERVLELYDFDKKTKVPVTVNMLDALVGESVVVAIKQAKEDNFNTPSESRLSSSITKFFQVDTKRTVEECIAGIEEGAFVEAWLKQHKDVIDDKRKLSKGEVEGATAGNVEAAPKKSFFGKKKEASAE